jgi:hypothetical protein
MTIKRSYPFTALHLKGISHLANISCLVSAIPFKFNPKTVKFVVTGWTLRRYKAFMLYIFGIIVLQDMRCFPVIIQDDVQELQKLTFGIALAFVTHFSFIPYIAIVLDPRRTCATLNGVLEYSSRFSRKSITNKTNVS